MIDGLASAHAGGWKKRAALGSAPCADFSRGPFVPVHVLLTALIWQTQERQACKVRSCLPKLGRSGEGGVRGGLGKLHVLCSVHLLTGS